MQDLEKLRSEVTRELTDILAPYTKKCQTITTELMDEMCSRVERYLKDMHIQDRIVDYQVKCDKTDEFTIFLVAMYKALNEDGDKPEITIDCTLNMKHPSFDDHFAYAMKGI